MILFLSDLHADERAWAWAKSELSSGEYSALFFGGDALASNAKMPIPEQLARRRRWFAELAPLPTFFAIGNHDFDGASGIGEGYWIHELASRHPHIHVMGLHPLPGGWHVRIVDYLEPVILAADNFPPKTILLNHVPPHGPCSWCSGVSFGDSMLSEDLTQAHSTPPALICSGHCHLPKANAWRQGRKKTLVLNPGVSPSGGRPNHFEIDLAPGHESVRWVSGDNSAQEFVMPIFAR
jgi:predicted phosphodiesterase